MFSMLDKQDSFCYSVKWKRWKKCASVFSCFKKEIMNFVRFFYGIRLGSCKRQVSTSKVSISLMSFSYFKNTQETHTLQVRWNWSLPTNISIVLLPVACVSPKLWGCSLSQIEVQPISCYPLWTSISIAAHASILLYNSFKSKSRKLFLVRQRVEIK